MIFYIIKDQLALLDIIATNINKRPIYWAVTCREDRLLGMQDWGDTLGPVAQIESDRFVGGTSSASPHLIRKTWENDQGLVELVPPNRFGQQAHQMRPGRT